MFLLDLADYRFERLSSSTSDVQKVSLRQTHFSYQTKMSSYRKESTDKQIIDQSREVFDKLQHPLNKKLYLPNSIQFTKFPYHTMKGDIQKTPEQTKETKLGSLPPLEQDRLIKAQIGRRLKQNELKGIRNMSISEINQIADKQVDPPLEGSRLNKIRHLNMKLGVTEDMLEHSIKSPGEKHLEMLEKSQMLRRYKISEFKKDPVMAQIKRGKLGVDNFFIFFGIFGSLMIPLYIFNKFKKHREDIVNSRIASPQVIKRLDQDSPISLDDVSYHTIHYYNPDRIKEEQAKKKRIEERQKLEKQLYF